MPRHYVFLFILAFCYMVLSQDYDYTSFTSKVYKYSSYNEGLCTFFYSNASFEHCLSSKDSYLHVQNDKKTKDLFNKIDGVKGGSKFGFEKGNLAVFYKEVGGNFYLNYFDLTQQEYPQVIDLDAEKFLLAKAYLSNSDSASGISTKIQPKITARSSYFIFTFYAENKTHIYAAMLDSYANITTDKSRYFYLGHQDIHFNEIYSTSTLQGTSMLLAVTKEPRSQVNTLYLYNSSDSRSADFVLSSKYDLEGNCGSRFAQNKNYIAFSCPSDSVDDSTSIEIFSITGSNKIKKVCSLTSPTQSGIKLLGNSLSFYESRGDIETLVYSGVSTENKASYMSFIHIRRRDDTDFSHECIYDERNIVLNRDEPTKGEKIFEIEDTSVSVVDDKVIFFENYEKRGQAYGKALSIVLCQPSFRYEKGLCIPCEPGQRSMGLQDVSCSACEKVDNDTNSANTTLDLLKCYNYCDEDDKFGSECKECKEFIENIDPEAIAKHGEFESLNASFCGLKCDKGFTLSSYDTCTSLKEPCNVAKSCEECNHHKNLGCTWKSNACAITPDGLYEKYKLGDFNERQCYSNNSASLCPGRDTTLSRNTTKVLYDFSKITTKNSIHCGYTIDASHEVNLSGSSLNFITSNSNKDKRNHDVKIVVNGVRNYIDTKGNTVPTNGEYLEILDYEMGSNTTYMFPSGFKNIIVSYDSANTGIHEVRILVSSNEQIIPDDDDDDDDDKDEHKSKKWLIIAWTIGVLGGAILIAAIFYFGYKKYSDRRRQQDLRQYQQLFRST